MSEYSKISLVTVCLNAELTIRDTLNSVRDQAYPNLQYIVVDGGSSDLTLDIINEFKDIVAVLISEKDKGPAFALNKGFRHCDGEIMAYLNADDVYLPNALLHVAGLFSKHGDVKWLTGNPCWMSRDGALVRNHMLNSTVIDEKMILKWSRWSRYRYLTGDAFTIQQESTFWKRSLWEISGAYIDEDFHYAYDFDLWCRFFRYERLYTTTALLAAFRFIGEKQISVRNSEGYYKEAYTALERERNIGSSWNKITGNPRAKLARILKPFYYYDFPLISFLYKRILHLPPLLQ